HAFRDGTDAQEGPNVEDVRITLEESEAYRSSNKLIDLIDAELSIDTIEDIKWGQPNSSDEAISAMAELKEISDYDLAMKHADIEQGLSSSKKALTREASSAAFWAAKISGADWTEAVRASRWAQEQISGRTEIPHDHVMNLYVKAYGLKTNQGE
ncbi:MAG: hypothetical protein WC087_04195, partial [Candidatus Paceibacterota bacterium]